MKMDKQEAVRWYRKSAEQGIPGRPVESGIHVRAEEKESKPTSLKRAELFRKSAESGFANAQYDLGMMLLQGLGGKQDRNEAEKWFHKAAEQGYREAKKILKELDRK